MNYDDMIKLEWRDGVVAYIPIADIYMLGKNGENFIEDIKKHGKHKEIRNEKYFSCPLCGKSSYYPWPCTECTIYSSIDEWHTWLEKEQKKERRIRRVLESIKKGKSISRSIRNVTYVEAQPFIQEQADAGKFLYYVIGTRHRWLIWADSPETAVRYLILKKGKGYAAEAPFTVREIYTEDIDRTMFAQMSDPVEIGESIIVRAIDDIMGE